MLLGGGEAVPPTCLRRRSVQISPVVLLTDALPCVPVDIDDAPASKSYSSP